MPADLPVSVRSHHHELTARGTQTGIEGAAHESDGEIPDHQEVDRRYRQEFAKGPHLLAGSAADQSRTRPLRVGGEGRGRMRGNAHVSVDEEEVCSGGELREAMAGVHLADP